MITTKKINLIWLFPLTALLIGFYLAYDKFMQLGDVIEISFNNAEGLEVGKTKIRYKNLDIGTVTNIHLADNLNEVIVTAQMNSNVNKLLREDSEFWIVKPQVSINGVFGLSTILSGSYIAVSPGKSTTISKKFIALKDIPLIEKSENGVRINLITENLSGLNVGSSIYYHGMKVGRIEKISFNDSFEHLILSAFIYYPYNQLITPDTHFWNISGFKVNIGSQGANFEIESFESLILGGISFSTPTSLIKSKNTNIEQMFFMLYPNESDTTGNSKLIKEYYVLYLPDSVRGLKTGAPVSFNGIDIGRVIEIRLIYDSEENKAKIPVLIELEPERITNVNEDSHDIIKELIKSGLSASLASDNLITGEKIIQLSINEKEKNKLLERDKYSQYFILPTSDTEINKITDDISTIINRIKKLPFENIMNNIEEITSNMKVLSKSTTKDVSHLLQSYSSLAQSLKSEFNQMNKNITVLIAQLNKTLVGISPNSSLYFHLEKTLQALEKMAKSLDATSKKFKDKPNSIIFGD